MDMDVALKKAIKVAVESIAETAIEEWDEKNGAGLKFLNRRIKEEQKRNNQSKNPLKTIEELNSLLNKLKIEKDQIPAREIRVLLGRLILFAIHYCDCLSYDPDECAKLALQYLSS